MRVRVRGEHLSGAKTAGGGCTCCATEVLFPSM